MDIGIILHCLSATIFIIGLLTVVMRKTTIIVLMGIELMLNAINLSFVTYAKELDHLSPQVMTIFVIVLAATESAIGLSIIINVYRNFGHIITTKLSGLRG